MRLLSTVNTSAERPALLRRVFSVSVNSMKCVYDRLILLHSNQCLHLHEECLPGLLPSSMANPNPLHPAFDWRETPFLGTALIQTGGISNSCSLFSLTRVVLSSCGIAPTFLTFLLKLRRIVCIDVLNRRHLLMYYVPRTL